MNHSTFAIQDDINLEDIENDPELLKELQSLGWNNHENDIKVHEPVQAKATTSRASNNNSQSIEQTHMMSEKELEQFMVTSTEDDLTFSDADEMDPDLLNAFDQLQNEIQPQQHHINATETSYHTSLSTTSSVSVRKPTVRSTTISSTSNQSKQASQPKYVNETYDESISISNSTSAPTPASSSLDEMRKMAVKLKREGKQDEALQLLKKIKLIEKGNTASDLVTAPQKLSRALPVVNSPYSTSIPLTSDSSATIAKSSSVQIPQKNSNVDNAESIGFMSNNDSLGLFKPLEKALIEAANVNLELAKQLKLQNNNNEAIIKMKEYKKYSQELDVLQGRRVIPGALPALFKWQNVRKETKIENKEISDDSLQVHILNIKGLDSVIQKYSSRTIILSYDLGIPKDAPITGKLKETIDNEGNVNFDYKNTIPSIIKRTSKNLTATLMTRKKVQFDVILKRGFFLSDVPLGSVTLPLTDLQTKCQCGGELDLVIEDEKGKKHTASGTLTVYIKLRTPITNPEVEVIEERVLLLDPWPDINQTNVTSNITHSAITTVPISVSSSNLQSIKPTSHIISAATVTTVNYSRTNAATTLHSKQPQLFDDLSDIEMSDPCNVTFLLSNDVLEDEKTRLQSLMQSLRTQKSTSSGNESEQLFHLKLRLQLIDTKLELLLRSVSQEQISMEDYLGMIKERCQKDLRLLQYLKYTLKALSTSRQDNKSDDDVIRVEDLNSSIKHVGRRILIMQKEINGVDENSGS